MVDAYPVAQTPPVVYITESEVRRQLGMEISLDQVADALARLDFDVKQVNDVPAAAHADATFGLSRRNGEPLVEATAPWHRLDIRFPADLTEEVARIIGYEKVGTTLMADVLPTQHHNAGQETQETLRDLLIGCGLQDTINYALTTPENHAKLNQRCWPEEPSLYRTGQPPDPGAAGIAPHPFGQRLGKLWPTTAASPTAWPPSNWAGSIGRSKGTACAPKRRAGSASPSPALGGRATSTPTPAAKRPSTSSTSRGWWRP